MDGFHRSGLFLWGLRKEERMREEARGLERTEEEARGLKRKQEDTRGARGNDRNDNNEKPS